MGDIYPQGREIILDLDDDAYSPEAFCAVFEVILTRDRLAKATRDRVEKYRIESILGQPGMGLDPSEE